MVIHSTSRRTVLKGIAGLPLLAGGIGLAGPAGAQEAFDWKKYSGTKIDGLFIKKPANDLLLANLNEFTDLTGITVSPEIIPEQQHRQKLVIEFGSGNPTFDVSELTLMVQKRLAAKGKWFADLKPMINDPALTSPEFDFADFAPGAIETSTQRDGQMDSLPFTLDYFLLYYNKELFEKKNVPLPKSMEEIATAAAALHDPSNGVAGFVARGLKNANVPVWTNFMFGWGEQAVGADGKLNTTSPEAIAAAKLYQTLLKDYGPVGVSGFNFNECQTTFSQGFAAMWLDSTAWARPLESKTTSKIAGKVGYMTIPPGPKGAASGLFSAAIGIARESKKREAAWLFLQWYANKANQVRLLQNGSGSAARISAFKDPNTISGSDLPREYFDTMAKCVEIGRPSLPDVIPVTEFRDTFGIALSNMINGADVEAELKTATEAFQPILEASEK